jgi:hypothetical protein
MRCLPFKKEILNRRRAGIGVELFIRFLLLMTMTVLFWGILGGLGALEDESTTHISSVLVTHFDYEKEGTASWIRGTVRNRSDSDLAYVKVIFALYGEDDEFLTTTFDHIYDLPSGDTVPFRAYVPEGKEIVRYSLVFAEGWDPWM